MSNYYLCMTFSTTKKFRRQRHDCRMDMPYTPRSGNSTKETCSMIQRSKQGRH